MQIRVTENQISAQPTWRDYLELTKPGMVSLLMLTMLASMFMAADGMPGLSVLLLTLLGSLLGASGACALNSYLEIDLDALMTRTRNRPLPAQRMKPVHALWFGLGLSALSIVVILLGANWLAAGLTLAGILTYVVVYTMWLKRRSVYSTFVGGIAGALPTLVGWVAIQGALSLEAMVLFAIVFYWTPAHLWSLALLRRNEYMRASLPMLPILQGPNAARIQIGRYSVLIVILTLLPVGMGVLKQYYALVALILGGFLVFFAIQLYLSPSAQTVMRYFKNSLLYLALLFGAMLAELALF